MVIDRDQRSIKDGLSVIENIGFEFLQYLYIHVLRDEEDEKKKKNTQRHHNMKRGFLTSH